jgi:PII-like signaling protein
LYPRGGLFLDLERCCVGQGEVLAGWRRHALHTAKILRLSQDLPVVIEIVDKEERLQAFLPVLDGMVDAGLITVEKVHIIAYRHGQEPT